MHKRAGFTLIEVMISVMIISLVITALTKMYANNSFIYIHLKQQVIVNEYSSFLVSKNKLDLSSENLSLYDLVDEFSLEHTLKRKLKEIKIDLLYTDIDSPFPSETEKESQLKITKSILKINGNSSFILGVDVR